jgi:glycosyltransferase involved in cell wall biosynthesis
VSDTIPILLAVYRRKDRLPALMDQLQAQTDQDFTLIVSVNGARSNRGAWARVLDYDAISADTEYAILIDDDLDLEPNFVEYCRSIAEPFTIKGRGARIFGKTYMDREPVEDGDECDCVGAQGTVLDARVLKHPELVDEIDPERIFMMDDLWLSFVAKTWFGYRLYRADTPATVVVDGKDAYSGLLGKKNELLQELRGRGWTA